MGLFDKIKDVIVDAAPVLVPMALNYFAPGMGSIASGALGAGIGSLIQGRDPEDALKAAALGGGIGALQAGFSGPKGNTFGQNIRADLGQTGTFLGDPLSPANYRQSVGGTYGAPSGNVGPTVEAAQNTNRMIDQAVDDSFLTEGSGMGLESGASKFNRLNTVEQVKDLTTLTEPSYLGGPFQAAPGVEDIVGSQQYADRVAALTKAGVPGANKVALDQLTKEFTPTFMQKFAAPAVGGITALNMMTDEPEEEAVGPYRTGADIFYDDEDRYRVDTTTFGLPTVPDVVVPYVRNFEDGGIASKYKGFSKLPEHVQQKMDPELAQKYAAGGDVEYFPRRTGGIGPGIGSGTKDDVPAMLMDGEFVMTRNAVRAAGGGNIEKGIDNMYGLMRNLEART